MRELEAHNIGEKDAIMNHFSGKFGGLTTTPFSKIPDELRDVYVSAYNHKVLSMIRYTLHELQLILSHLRAIRYIDIQCYRSIRNAKAEDLYNFLKNLGMINA